MGFYVPTFIQVAAETKPAIRHIGRTARKQTRRLAASKPENEHQRLTQDHQGKLMNVFDRESRKARMNTLPGTAVKEMPKISAPVEKQRQ